MSEINIKSEYVSYGRLRVRHRKTGYGVEWREDSRERYHKAHSLEEVDELNEGRHKFYWGDTMFDILKEKGII